MKTKTTTPKIQIESAEICDLNNNETPTLGQISVIVTAKIGKKIEMLEYQTTGTFDCGAVSSELGYYDGGISNIDEETAEKIGRIAKIQQIFDRYIEANYQKDESWFGGLDASSENNELQYRQ